MSERFLEAKVKQGLESWLIYLLTKKGGENSCRLYLFSFSLNLFPVGVCWYANPLRASHDMAIAQLGVARLATYHYHAWMGLNYLLDYRYLFCIVLNFHKSRRISLNFGLVEVWSKLAWNGYTSVLGND